MFLSPGSRARLLAARAHVGRTDIRTVIANYTIAITDLKMTIEAGTGSTGFFTITLPAATGFPEGFSVSVVNNDTARAKGLSGFPSTLNTRLWPGQALAVKIVKGAWVTTVDPGRWGLTGNVTLNIDNVNGNDANDGLATGSGNALASIQAAFNLARDNFDGCGHALTVLAPSGQTFTAGLELGDDIFLNSGGGFVDFQSLILDLGTSTLNTTSGDAILVCGRSTPPVTVQNLTLQTTTSGECLHTLYGGQIYLGNGIIFGACAGDHICSQVGGQIRATLISYTVNGGAVSHIYLDADGVFYHVSATVTLNGTLAFSNAFVTVQSDSQAHFGSVTYTVTGTVTGKRYQVVGSGGSINTEGAGSATYFPGNSAGTLCPNGFYDAPGTPTVASGGGTSPSIVGTDQSFRITMGTSAPTQIVLNWAQAHASAPRCVVTWEANPLATQNYSSSTTQLTINQTGTSSNKITVQCYPTG